MLLLTTNKLEDPFNGYSKDCCFVCSLRGQSCHYYRHTYMRIFDTRQYLLYWSHTRLLESQNLQDSR